jgi:hypothetical protein
MAYALVRLLIALNWLYGAIVLVILVGLFSSPHWTMTALGIPEPAQTAQFLNGFQLVPMLGLAATPLNLGLLRRLVAMILSVRAGNAFANANSVRLRAIAWFLLGQQMVSLAVALVARVISTPSHQLHLSAGFSPGAWLAVILVFVLAELFAEGTRMRDDLEGTV